MLVCVEKRRGENRGDADGGMETEVDILWLRGLKEAEAAAEEESRCNQRVWPLIKVWT